MGKQLAAQQQSVPTGCAVFIRSEVSTQAVKTKVSTQAVKHKDVQSENVRKDFEPFVLEGSVSLDSDNVNPKPIKIMRDTCCAQSMILEGSCPLVKLGTVHYFYEGGLVEYGGGS